MPPGHPLPPASAAAPGCWEILVDTGGTFTDCLGRDPVGRWHRAKVLSTGAVRAIVGEKVGRDDFILELPAGNWPEDFFAGFTANTVTGKDTGIFITQFSSKTRCVRLAAPVPENWPPGTLLSLASGEEAPVLGARVLTGTPCRQALPPLTMRLATTRGTNALLEDRGAPVVLFVTEGFGDLLKIGDQRRPDLFALNIVKPPPLARWVVEVPERLDACGEVVRAFDEIALSARLDSVKKSWPAGVVAAVALLHADVNPMHEHRVAEILRASGFAHVSESAQIAPFIKILPRAQTAVVNATLAPVMNAYFDAVARSLNDGHLRIMTSAGGLVSRAACRPCDTMLSGPAGGLIGAVSAARAAGLSRVLTFDMGGTSTDVARWDGELDYQSTHSVGRATLLAPALKIESVAAGGGSICGWRAGALIVGPASAGAQPGPACYGAGGPLTITDVNLLLGRLDSRHFGLPVQPKHTRARFTEQCEIIRENSGEWTSSPETLLQGWLDIANERMADAIRRISVREGYAPAEYALVAFGGAGGQHACAVADHLGVTRILFPAEAGHLSARGLGQAAIERIAERQVLADLEDDGKSLEPLWRKLEGEALSRLREEENLVSIRSPRRQVAMRLTGQEAALTIEAPAGTNLRAAFENRFAEVFGYLPGGVCEVTALRVIVSSEAPALEKESFAGDHPATPSGTQRAWLSGSWRDLPVFERSELYSRATLAGPALVADSSCTLIIEPGWSGRVGAHGSILLERTTPTMVSISTAPAVAERELFTQRFRTLVEAMGTQLQRTALSTNVKERLDFSCGLLDTQGRLVANAPHIPVHLGALGLCVRLVEQRLNLRPGDVAITNHPAFGGSHLPDVTVITPVFDDGGRRLGYVASRAHHAEIGGIRPGSMPPGANNLAEEGVVLEPFRLFDAGRENFAELERRLHEAPWPTRALVENLADIRAQVAANVLGAQMLRQLAQQHHPDRLARAMDDLRAYSAELLVERLTREPTGPRTAEQFFDDGTPVQVSVQIVAGRLRVDFTDTGGVHKQGLNAPPAITRAAVLYVLRLLAGGDLPLNEGLFNPVDLVLPLGLLNPPFSGVAAHDPAVAGGNVETSQRVVDTLLLAFGVAACSQGTMNNLVFGDTTRSYYETIGGGAGASPGFSGASAVHVHMTNTAITDPEVLERRFPVRLRQFAIRRGSGGVGRWPGGDGLVRELEFLAPQSVSLLTQRRVHGPDGAAGGGPGQPGRQTLFCIDGQTEILPSLAHFEAVAGDILRIETPGGGGWGAITGKVPPRD